MSKPLRVKPWIAAVSRPGSPALCAVSKALQDLGLQCPSSPETLAGRTQVTPTLVPNYKGANEGAGGRSNCCADHSTMGNATLVSCDHKHVGRPTGTPPKHPRSVDSVSQLRLSSIGNAAPVGRMEGLRQHFRTKEIPSNAVDLIMSSWRSKTNSNYNSAWRKWEEWCRQRGTHPFSADVPSILGFLADQYEEGRQYWSLNCYRSALSSTHLSVEGFPVGQHPLVIRLLKGVFNQRPPQPRYTHTWDVSNSEVGNATGHSYTPEGGVLPCNGLAKQSRPGNEKSLEQWIFDTPEDMPSDTPTYPQRLQSQLAPKSSHYLVGTAWLDHYKAIHHLQGCNYAH